MPPLDPDATDLALTDPLELNLDVFREHAVLVQQPPLEVGVQAAWSRTNPIERRTRSHCGTSQPVGMLAKKSAAVVPFNDGVLPEVNLMKRFRRLDCSKRRGETPMRAIV